MRNARIIYNELHDAFDLEINTGDGWGLDSRYNCHTSTKNPMGDANFISFTILKKLRQLEDLGYKIHFAV